MLSSSGNVYQAEFQSTLPVRGATQAHTGGRAGLTISIHAPREGSDCQLYSHLLQTV